jgi:MFS family permease
MFLTFPVFGPLYAKDAHPDVKAIEFSVISSMYNLSRLIFSTFIGANISRVGKKNSILIGFCILITCCCSFATLEFIQDSASDYFFFGASCLINFVQGLGGSTLQICG